MLTSRIKHIALIVLALALPRATRAQESAAPAAASAENSPTAAAASTQAAQPEAAPTAADLAAQRGHPFIAHLPVSSAPAGNIELAFDVRGPDLAGELIVYFRPLGDPQGVVRSARAGRDERGFRATLPGHLVEGEGFAYWVVERTPGGLERPVFASRERPYPLHVIVGGVDNHEQRLLKEHGGRRSRFTGVGEWVDLGSFQASGPASKDPQKRDHYGAFEAQYAYRFFRMVEELEVSVGLLRGKATQKDYGLYDQQNRLGLNYGRTAITYAFGDWVRVRTGILFGVSTRGFEGGADGALIIGDHRGTEFKLYGNFVSHFGGAFGARLGWATVPRVPMGARVEVTNFPNVDQFGVRLLFDAGVRIGDAGMVRLIAGYRGRTSLAGGPSLGTEITYAF